MELVFEQIKKLARDLADLRKKRIYQDDIVPQAVKQRHIDGLIVFRGLIADRPSNGDTEIQIYWAEDENKLYIWNDTSDLWKSVTLT
jgi:hypothetical protein